MRIGVAFLCMLPALAAPAVLCAQTAENVAVVINDNSPDSRRIGEYYVTRRAIPGSNVLRIRTSVEEAISREVYVGSIEAPISAALMRAGLQDRVLYLVLTKGVPLRIEGTTGQNGTMASVDSELTLLYRRMAGIGLPVVGRVDNPFYAGTTEPATLSPFTHRDHDIYLVTRLDAFTVEEALALVDRGGAPVEEGRIVLDQQDRLVNRTGEDWLEIAAERLRAGGHGERVVLETTVQGARDIDPVLGYYSWGSSDPRNRVRTFGMKFVPGSLAAMFASFTARTFREPPDSWVPTANALQSTWFEGASHSLIGDLIREGVTGAAGYVTEPYLQSTIRPEVLFPAYLSGANLAEAFYRAMPHLSWQTVVVGDPLCAPFRERPLSRAEIEGGIDPDTTLPSFFARHRIATMTANHGDVPEGAIRLAVRGEALLTRGERDAGREALEQATALAPSLASAHLQLALLHEQAGEVELAVERYRHVVAGQPTNAVALNNLAYRLAVDLGAPAEALPLAKQAVSLLPKEPTVLDTLAWVQYLLGDHAEAAATMARAIQGGPQNAEIRLHAAIIYAANGAKAVAQDQLREALRLRPSLEDDAEVKRLQSELGEIETR